jgi:hypothetical protein
VTAVSAPLYDGVYKIVSLLDGKKVLEVKGGKANVGTPVDLWQDNDKPHQRWQLTKIDEENGEVFYTIGHPGSGLVMEAPGRAGLPWEAKEYAGTGVVLRGYQSNGGDQRHRQWKLKPVSGKQDIYTIINRRSGFAIDVEHGDPKNGVIKQYALWNAPDDRQRWELIPVPAPPVPRKVALVNGGFEQPTVTASTGWEWFPDASQTQHPKWVPGWLTTATDHLIEIWESGVFEGVASDEGTQHAELNANHQVATLYQDLETTPGTTLSWRLSHRGSVGVDTMAVDIGAPGAVVEQQRMTDDNKAWKRYAGTYTVPAGQTITRFACRSISSHGENPNRGNLVDGVFFGTE